MTDNFPLIRTSISLALLVAAAGCANQAAFPSLALRPAELNGSFEAPVRAPIAVASDRALLDRIASLESQARAGEQAFAREAVDAARAVGAAGPAQSEGWVSAQIAVSRLEASRAPTAAALGDLDALRLERAAVPTSEADYARLIEAWRRTEQLASSQIARLEALQSRLPGR